MLIQRCYYDPPQQPWLLSCIYGSPHSKRKFKFWDSIAKFGKNYNGSWLCIGDFHMILNQSKKIGGWPYASSSNDLFQSFMDSFGMVDLGFIGNPFT